MARSHDRASLSPAPPSRLTHEVGASYTDAETTGPAPAPGRGNDPLSDVLRTVKLTGALFFMVDATHPWGVEVPRTDRVAPAVLPGAQHVISYDIILEGSGWVCMQGAAPVRFEGGDILVFAHSDPYLLLSAPDQQPEFDSIATVEFLREMAAGRLPFVVEEGGGGPERTRYVCGYLGCDMRPFNPVLATLPRFLQVKRRNYAGDELLDHLVELTLAEARTRRAGGDSIRLRLSELIFVEVIRRYLETLPVGGTGWLAGLRDRSVGRVLTLFHEHPARAWTLNELASESGLSRAVLAERFAHLVGCPPMKYLTLWRMQIAARMLADRPAKVAAVAHDVGYESEAAFSRAFKKATGVSPAAWRDHHVASA